MCVCTGVIEAGALSLLLAWLLRQRKKWTRLERDAQPGKGDGQ